MPHLNTLGEWCSGIAGVGVFWQGGTIWVEGGGAAWLTRDEVIGQKTGPTPPVGLYKRDIRTGAEALLLAAPISLVEGSGAGHWAVQIPDGVRDSFGRLHRGIDAQGQAGPSGTSEGALGPDGSLAIKRLYLSNGPWDVVEPDGSRWLLTSGNVSRDLVNYGLRTATWLNEAGAWQSIGVPVPLPLTAPAWWFRYVSVPDSLWPIWQLYQAADGRLLFHPRGDTWGYELDQGPNTFRPDASVSVVDGRITIAWSIRQGDAPDAIRVRQLSLSEPRVDLSVPPPPPMPPVASVPLLNRVFGVACYTFNDAPSLGNITIPIRPTATHFDQPIILPSDRPDLAAGNDVWAVYAGENAALTCEAAIDQARPLGNALHRGLDIYQDSPNLRPSVVAKATLDDVLGCILKREPTETIPAFKARLSTMAIGAWPSIHLVDSPSRAAETFIAVCDMAAAGRFRGFSLFAIGRSNVPDRELAPYIARLMSGITGTPLARVIPEESDMAAIGKRLTEVFEGVEEIPMSDGTVGLKLLNVKSPSGHDKVKCTTPEGKDEVRPEADVPLDINRDVREWERYKKTPTSYVAERGTKSYVYPRA
jgi:hypothetical protein